jgi:hypothetical protein
MSKYKWPKKKKKERNVQQSLAIKEMQIKAML